MEKGTHPLNIGVFFTILVILGVNNCMSLLNGFARVFLSNMHYKKRRYNKIGGRDEKNLGIAFYSWISIILCYPDSLQYAPTIIWDNVLVQPGYGEEILHMEWTSNRSFC